MDRTRVEEMADQVRKQGERVDETKRRTAGVIDHAQQAFEHARGARERPGKVVESPGDEPPSP